MKRKFFSAVLLGAAALSTTLVVGCSSANEKQPYALTGNSHDQMTAEREASRQRLMYTDDKGHYRADLEAQHRPLRYVP